MSDEHLRFVLQRDEDVTGVSGTGVVAQGVWWPDGDVVALRWTSQWPTSVVFHERGMESVLAVHGHNGKTRMVWLDADESEPPDLFAAGDSERWSRTTIGGKRLTWRELAEHQQAELTRANALATVLADLDRCEHGRHEGDVCSSCMGPSHGNPIAAKSNRIEWRYLDG